MITVKCPTTWGAVDEWFPEGGERWATHFDKKKVQFKYSHDKLQMEAFSLALGKRELKNNKKMAVLGAEYMQEKHFVMNLERVFYDLISSFGQEENPLAKW